jgi:hypothetical protein
MPGELLLTGQNTPMRVFVNGEVYGDDILMSAEVTEVTTEFRDDHLGEGRSNPDKQVDGYDLDLTLHVANNRLIQALLDVQAARDARRPIPVIAVMIALEERATGRTSSYIFTQLVTAFRLSIPSRKERLTLNIKCRARDMKPVAR